RSGSGSEIRAGRRGRIAALDRLDQMIQPVAIGTRVGIDERDDFAGCGADACIARGGETIVLDANRADSGVAGDFRSRIGRSVVDESCFVVWIVELANRGETFA